MAVENIQVSHTHAWETPHFGVTHRSENHKGQHVCALLTLRQSFMQKQTQRSTHQPVTCDGLLHLYIAAPGDTPVKSLDLLVSDRVQGYKN